MNPRHDQLIDDLKNERLNSFDELVAIRGAHWYEFTLHLSDTDLFRVVSVLLDSDRDQHFPSILDTYVSTHFWSLVFVLAFQRDHAHLMKHAESRLERHLYLGFQTIDFSYIKWMCYTQDPELFFKIFEYSYHQNNPMFNIFYRQWLVSINWKKIDAPLLQSFQLLCKNSRFQEFIQGYQSTNEEISIIRYCEDQIYQQRSLKILADLILSPKITEDVVKYVLFPYF